MKKQSPSPLLLATHNSAKIREYRALLEGMPYHLVTLTEAGISLKVPEVGASFEENATAKTRAYLALSHHPTLAEDSGLEVDILGGEPGVHSARYAGESATDTDRIQLLLARMQDIPWERRQAHFICVIALAWPAGELELVRGQCQGLITMEPRGSYGFGYDPIFYIPELDRTMAELSLEEKNRVSHRGQAARQARHLLESRARAGVLS